MLGTSSSQLEPELKTCNYCKKEFKANSLNRHIAKSAKCKDYYGPEFDNMKKSAKSMRNKGHHSNNSKSIRKRKADYNESNREEIKEKQAKYNERNREEIKEKQAKYNAQHADEIRRKQSTYNNLNRMKICEKQRREEGARLSYHICTYSG